MGAGGATWDTAGTLDLGGGNTFDVAEATVIEPDGFGEPYNQAWWALTVSERVRVTLNTVGSLNSGIDTKLFVYTGADYASRVVEALSDDFGDGLGLLSQVTLDALVGVTYHVLVGTYAEDDAAALQYRVNYSRVPLIETPWLEDLQDDPDNYLIVTHGALAQANLNPVYQFSIGGGPSSLDWQEQVVRFGQARRGSYFIVEALGGDPVINAISCAVAHADNGDIDDQIWNATGHGASGTKPPVCLPLGTGDAADHGSITATHYEVAHAATTGSLAGTARSDAQGPSYGLWFLPVRDNLQPYGTLFDFSLDPADYGYPDDAYVEWEAPTVGLVRIELADGDPLPDGDAPYIQTWALNPKLPPSWENGSSRPWQKGPATLGPDVDPGPNVPYLSFEYDDGDDAPEDVEWHEIPNTEGWDGHDWHEAYETVSDETPDGSDGVVLCWPVMGESLGSWSRDARIAVKFVLQAQRFRFVYPTPTRAFPPRRGWPRNQATTAARGIGGQDSIQDGARGVGAVV